MPYTVAIAGTTDQTTLCAQALLEQPQLKVSLVITPAAKPMGRKKLLTPNPLQKFADSNQIPTVLIKNRIDDRVKKQILAFQKPDFLLVVDFGYLVPKWLLDLPKKMPLNLHPSALPKWRGSSPGQFVLLSGAQTSAITLIEMTTKFDQGPIVWQKEFEVDPSWTQTEYYQHSFELAVKNLAAVILQLAKDKISPTPQSVTSPTPIAKKLTKTAAFEPWIKIKAAMTEDKNDAAYLERASRAYSPWPLLWTEVTTGKGPRRMQLISAKINTAGLLVLKKVKIEGMAVKPWSEVKNVVKD